MSNFKIPLGYGLGYGLGLGLGLGLVLLLITLKKFIFTQTQPKVNRDFENNIWRHLLNIINDRIVEVRFSVIEFFENKSELVKNMYFECTMMKLFMLYLNV